MSAVHDRWELVEPLLFTHALRDPSAFRDGATKRSHNKDLTAIRREHRIEDTAIAEAFSLFNDASSALDREEPIYAHIRRVSTHWLVSDGDHWALRIVPRRPGHEIIRWRCLTMLLPPSIVAAGALAATERSGPCWVQVLPDSIAPSEAVGHLHVHLGPLLPFETLWLQLWGAFLRRGTLDAWRNDGIASIKERDLPEIGKYSSKRQPGMRWQWILELAFAARIWLLHKAPPLPYVLRSFSRGQIDLDRRAGALLSLWSQQEWRDHARRDARRLSESRLRDDRDMSRGRTSAVNAEIGSATATARTPKYSDDEVVFLAQSLRHCDDLERSGDSDNIYARVLYQYLRAKVALYRSLVVDPWTIGLRHFLDVVQRDGPYAKVIDDDGLLDKARLDAARTEKPLRVEALEVHVPPTRWLKQGRRVPEGHAWVLSFVRAERPESKDPDGIQASKRWRLKAAEVGATCRLLARCMAMRPSVLRELRGLSLMDWERNGPVWLFEAPFRRLIVASAEIAAGHPRLHLRSIRTAFHLGEDFHHILSGLRQIFEPFEWGLIGRGDRVGHALALGLSPAAWCEENSWVRMRPWDRILDIGFVYWAFGELGLQLDAGHMERMRLDAGKAIRHVFEVQGHDPLEVAMRIWLSLPRIPPKGSDEFVARVLDDHRVGRRALSPTLTVETKHDLPVLQVVHDAVLDRVAKWQVAVEVNPSSNLLVGGFRSIFQQPAFHADDLPLTMNADDPMTFATTLADDYAYAWAGMVVGAKQSRDQATRRLEEAARCSMRYAFTEQQANMSIRGAVAPRRVP